MIENILVHHFSVAAEAEKIGTVERLEVKDEGASESDDEKGSCVGVFENCAGDPGRCENR